MEKLRQTHVVYWIVRIRSTTLLKINETVEFSMGLQSFVHNLCFEHLVIYILCII
jgi:hypothetical protein